LRFTGTLLLVCVGIFAVSAAAQPASPPQPVTRTIVAASKLPSVVETPLYFRALQLALPPRESSTLSATNGTLYQISGATEVAIAAETKDTAGEALFVATGQTASLKAASDPSTMLLFLLTPDPDRNRPVVAVPLSVKELYRGTAPIPDLKAGTYDLNLTRVTFPPRMPSNPPHHRSGAALYYVLGGTGANTISGKTEAKGPGSFIYEPPCTPMGQCGGRAVHVPGLQHQSGGRGGRCSW
jgi:hypothetical protein